MSAAPLFSVIVVCKNPGPRLQAALGSVWEQQGPAPELIIVDGASNDGSREWLEANRRRIAVLISEPDRGIYEAMNKGLARAQGDWVYFLGADDRFTDSEILLDLALHSGSTAGVLVGEAQFEDGRRYRMSRNPSPAARNFVHHQAAFYRRALFAEHGAFDPGLRIMGDYDFNLRLWRRGVRFAPLPVDVARCGVRGRSDAGSWTGYREEIVVRHRHFSAVRCACWDAGSVVRFIRKKLRRQPVT